MDPPKLSTTTVYTNRGLLIRGSYDVVVTVCSQKASELCPLFPGRALRLNWPLDDPSRLEGDRETKLAGIRTIREEIKGQVEAFISEYHHKGLKMFL